MFGAAVPERNPRTRTSRALKFRIIGDLGSRNSARAEYRYFWDTWNIRASTAEVGYSRYLAPGWLADGFVRYYTQQHALFYSDNAQTETLYVSRNRQLSTFHDVSLGAKVTYTLKSVPGQYDVHLTGAYQLMSFHYKDYTDVRTGSQVDTLPIIGPQHSRIYSGFQLAILSMPVDNNHKSALVTADAPQATIRGAGGGECKLKLNSDRTLDAMCNQAGGTVFVVFK